MSTDNQPASSKSFFRTRYRIIRDKEGWYIAKFRPWWCPIWISCYIVNLNSSLDEAEALADRHRNPVVKVLD